MWDSVAGFVSALVAVASLLAGGMRWRETMLRREDVLAWSNEVIRTLQSLVVICIHNDQLLKPSVMKEKITEIMFDSSILVERGRLFFKNEIVDDHGEEKEPAYRGYRPAILDPIVVAHQIACNWNEADEDARLRMRLIAEDCLKKFVSLAQKEIGRSRTASVDTKRGGDGAHLQHLLPEVDEVRLAKLRVAR